MIWKNVSGRVVGMKKGLTKIIEKRRAEHILNSTAAEILMAAKLHYNKITFEREYAILTEKSFFTSDFYIPKYGLLIEVDGGYHDNVRQAQQDLIKDIVYKSFGYNVLRIKNSEVEFFDVKTLRRFKKKLISKYRYQ